MFAPSSGPLFAYMTLFSVFCCARERLSNFFMFISKRVSSIVPFRFSVSSLELKNRAIKVVVAFDRPRGLPRVPNYVQIVTIRILPDVFPSHRRFVTFIRQRTFAIRYCWSSVNDTRRSQVMSIIINYILVY
jgi:hypothetical protein